MPLSKAALELAAILDPDIRVTPWTHLPGAGTFRIWVCRTTFGWFQRHEWQRPGFNDTHLEAWIPSPIRSFGTATLPPPEDT